MCFIKDIARYWRELTTDSNSLLDEEINEINVGPGQSFNVDEYGYTGVITCISYELYKVQLNGSYMYYDNVNDCYNWLVRTVKYMMEFDYHIA